MTLFSKSQPDSFSQVSPSAGVRRRTDREMTPGRCGNLDYCSIGMQRVLVQVPVSQPFICPECGGRLRPPGSRWGNSRPALLPFVRIGVLAACCALSAWAGYHFGRLQPKMTAALESSAKLNAARAMLGLPPLPDGAVVAPPPPPPPVHVEPPPPPKPVPLLVGNTAYPWRAPQVDVSDPPQHLKGETRFGQVTIDCTLPALAAKPTCRVGDVRGGDAFSASALKYLQDLLIDYAPAQRGGTQVLLDHRWRITFADYNGLPRAAGAK